MQKEKEHESFMRIYDKESNENTAFVLMLSIICEKLDDIAELISKSNKKFDELLLSKKTEKRKEIIIIQPLTAEDYMD